jgi:hypothetical protein
MRKPPLRGFWACQVFILVVELNLLFFFLVLFLRANVFAHDRFIHPVVLTQYPRAHKCSPLKLRLQPACAESNPAHGRAFVFLTAIGGGLAV